MDPTTDENAINGIHQNIKESRNYRERRGVIGRKLAGKRTDRSVLGELTNVGLGVNQESTHYDSQKNTHPAKIRRSNNYVDVFSDSSSLTNSHNQGIKNKITFADISSPGVSNEMASLKLNKSQDFDIDSINKKNQIYVSEYASIIYDYFFSIESRDAPNAIYLQEQTDLNSKMRSILIDWLVDVHKKFKLQEQTLYITINLIDRYLMKQKIQRQFLQLVGVAAMFLAAKYEEIYPPEVLDFVKITDDAYNEQQIFQMEENILKGLQYRISNPTCYQFLQRFLQASKSSDPRTDQLAAFVITRVLQEYKMLNYLPSKIAASAVYLARSVLKEFPIWPAILKHHTRYSSEDLSPCLRDLNEILSETNNNSNLNAVKRKFSSAKYLQVALFRFDALEIK